MGGGVVKSQRNIPPLPPLPCKFMFISHFTSGLLFHIDAWTGTELEASAGVEAVAGVEACTGV